MRRVLRFDVAGCLPSVTAVLAAAGMPAKLTARTEKLFEQALTLFGETAEPAGVWQEILRDEFGQVFAGDGQNAADSPVGAIGEQGDWRALFCVTLGSGISEEIGRCFEKGDFALGFVLDAVASAGAEQVAEQLEQSVEARGKVVRYSPGYCGWHVSGQRRLFEWLRPEEIGVSLRPSFLMEPLKSISGVLVAGDDRIHRIRGGFSFCGSCTRQRCRI